MAQTPPSEISFVFPRIGAEPGKRSMAWQRRGLRREILASAFISPV
jgi:hypothetical protein